MNTWDKSNLTLPSPKSPELEDLIARNSQTIRYPAKSVIHVPGDTIGGVYYSLKGRMRHYMVAVDGKEKLLYTLSEGWFFGETPYFLNQPTGLYSSAETEMIVALIPADRFQSLMDESKIFREAIMMNYSHKMRILRYEVENLSFYSCKERIKHLLCSVVDTKSSVDGSWYRLKVRYTQYEIGIIIGGARVTVTKLLNELCDEGFIRILNRKIQVSKAGYQSTMDLK